MSLPLALKYRPSTFRDVIGQNQIITSLSSALDSHQVHHAYLFSGPRGCGKTSSARILARSLNCEKGPTSTPCESCQSCRDLIANGPGSLDVIEMDAATHGLVDDARELRDKALFAPVSSRYKIYIIDEAHQLGPAAANALLKIVEEPPPYVVFVFATTEPEKVIPTIRSRTHHYQFRLVDVETLANYLNIVSEREGATLDTGVIDLAVRAGNGSVRDSLSALGQLINGAINGNVSYDAALHLLGQTSNGIFDRVLKALINSQADELIQFVSHLLDSGSDIRRFTLDLLDRMRDLMVISASSEGKYRLLRSYSASEISELKLIATSLPIASLIKMTEVVAEHLVKLRSTHSPQITLETMMMRLLQVVKKSSDTLTQASRTPSKDLPSNIEDLTSGLNQNLSIPTAVMSTANPDITTKVVPVDFSALQESWPRVLENIKHRRRLTWTLLSSQARPISLEAGVIKIGFSSSGALESFDRSKSADVLQAALKEVFQGDFSFEIVVTDSKSIEVSAPVEVGIDDFSDQLTGEELLMKELGARVISKDSE